MDWEALALYLADCHAATTEYDGELRSTSKARRERLQNICRKAHEAIETGTLAANVHSRDVVSKRLRRAARLPEDEPLPQPVRTID